MRRNGIHFLGIARAAVYAAAFAAALVPLLASCSRPGPPPRSGNSGAIGIMVETGRADGKGQPLNSDKVYFIRLRENTELRKQTELYHSNFREGGQVYLLNARPGRYVVVAASVFRTQPGAPTALDRVDATYDNYRIDTTYFDEALVLQTTVAVRPDEFSVAGNYAVKTEHSVNFGGKIQRYFHRVVHKTVTDPYGNPVIGAHNSTASRATLGENRSGGDWEKRFLNAAKEHLAGSDWEPLVRKRLGAPAR